MKTVYHRCSAKRWRVLGALLLAGSTFPSWADVSVLLTEVPDYSWYAGCFGTASGNLMGYWDRHGFPNFYTGPTAGGLAPLSSDGVNVGVRSMWASKAGLDGRPADQFGHIDDYWLYYNDDVAFSYESTAPDPYLTAGRPEHTPDCVGDFIGLSQRKWKNLNGECDGNIDAFSFVFWDASGQKRTNFIPPSQDGQPIPDIPSGLRAWTQFRGNDAEVFSQLVEFNPAVPSGRGFTFQDLKAEIDAGYPVLLFLQKYNELFRTVAGVTHLNPHIHGMLAYGYHIDDEGQSFVRYKTSWGGSGDVTLSFWSSDPWQANLPVRGVIGYHPLPQIRRVSAGPGTLTLQWDGPASMLSDGTSTTPLHYYVVEKADSLNPVSFEPVSDPTTDHSITLTNCCPGEASYFRLKLLPPAVLTHP